MFSSVTLIVGAVHLYLLPASMGVRLPACTSQGWTELDESSTYVPITCDQFQATDTVIWRLFRNSAYSSVLGSCRPTSCSASPINPLTRPTPTTSVFSIANLTVGAWGSWDIECAAGGDSARCQLNVVSPPSLTPSNCSVGVNTTTDTWAIHGSCYVSRAYSSRDFYSCQWRQTSSAGGSPESPGGQKDDRPSTPSDYYSYTCTFNTALPSQAATYTYTLTVSPGDVTVTAGAYTVELPSSPQPGCKNGYYREGDTLSCTCTLDTPGSPPASVLWLNNPTTGATLSMPVTSQDNNRQLICQARWGTRTLKTTSYTIRVAYRSDQPTINIKTQPYPFLAGDTPTLYCGFSPGADRGNPPAGLTWRGGTRSPSQDEISLQLAPLTAADNGRQYYCEATNAFTVGQNFTIQVYYLSEVHLTRLPGDDCVMQSPNTCVVQDEQRVHFNCSAESNPDLATAAWQSVNSHVLDLTVSPDTNVTRICNVSTEAKGDNRLPLVGSGHLTILVTSKTSNTGPSTPGGLSAGAAVGVTLALMSAAVGVVLVWLWRRHWVLPCIKQSSDGGSSPEHVQQAVLPPPAADRGGNQNANWNQMQEETPPVQNEYASLRTQDIGLRSEYDDLSRYVNTGVTSTNGTGPVYANTRQSDKRPYANMAESSLTS